MRPKPAPSQTWATFLKTHATDIVTCDFLQVVDVFFCQVYLFFIIELGTRRVVHVGVTREPTQAWVAQQWREATPYGQIPRFVIRDDNGKYGHEFERDSEVVWHGRDPHAVSSSQSECRLRKVPEKRSAGVPGSHPDLQRTAAASDCESVRGVLRPRPTASGAASVHPVWHRRGCPDRVVIGKGDSIPSAERTSQRLSVSGLKMARMTTLASTGLSKTARESR